MNCPKCSKRLAWEDGAFCKSCMVQAEYALRSKAKPIDPNLSNHSESPECSSEVKL